MGHRASSPRQVVTPLERHNFIMMPVLNQNGYNLDFKYFHCVGPTVELRDFKSTLRNVDC